MTTNEIKHNREYIFKNVNEKQNYFIRQGIANKLVSKYISQNGIIVELGAGSGQLAKELVSNGYKYIHLIDIDNYLAGGFFPDVVSFHQLDLSFNELPFVDNSVDVVLAFAILEHLENPVLAIREAARILKGGGIFMVAIPWIFSLRSKMLFYKKGDLKGYNRENNHIFMFTRAVFDKIFLKFFNIIETHYSDRYITIFGKKIRLPGSNKWIGKYFSDKVLYVFQKR